MRRSKRIAALGVSMALMAAAPACTWAAQGDYDAETWAKLQDNALEYEEIQDLVVEYNPMYQSMMQGIAANTAPVTQGIADLREEADSYSELYQAEKEDDGNPILAEVYRTSASQLRKSANTMERSISSSTRLSVNSTRKQLTSAVQSLMIQYQNLMSTRGMLQALVDFSQASYNTAQIQLEIGMATAADVQAAQTDLLDAQNNLQQVDNGIAAVRQNLCIMTGWSYDAMPEIGQIPTPDLEKITQMNPDIDIQKAISNNYELIEQKHVIARGTADYNAKERTIEDSESLLRANLQTLYQTVLQSQTAYEAASSSYQSAQITMNGANLQYQQGMIGRLEFLGAQLSFAQQKMTYEQASLALFQAMETYDWAVEGLADIQ